MNKYYLLEYPKTLNPDNEYYITVEDKVFLNSIKKLKNKTINVFVTLNRKPLDDFNDDNKDLDIYDESGFNKFFGVYGTLTNEEKNNYKFSCQGIAEVVSGVYKEDKVEYLDITKAEVDDYYEGIEEHFIKLKAFVRDFANQNNINDFLYNIKSPNKFINKNLDKLPFTTLEKRKVVYTTNLQKKVEYFLELMLVYVIPKEIVSLKKDIDSKVRTNIDNQQKEYFLREQIKVAQDELKKVAPEDDDIEKLKKQIKELGLDRDNEEAVLSELSRLEKTPSMAPENSIIRSYLETIISLPWKTFTKDAIDIEKAEKILDEEHYGLEKIKERILEFLAVKKLKDDMKSPILCLSGPPGVGKSSLAKSIAKAMERKFIRVSLGGVRDESEIRGHRRTYVGALPGKFIQSLKKVKVKNPVILLDEIDKMSSDIKGDPASAMLEVIDPEQNNEFVDHYLDIPFDLSSVLFIATANNLSSIPTPLRDRMEIIELESYTIREKENIAKKYLIPQQIEENGLTKKDITFTKQAINKIIVGYTYEAGVRNLDRVIAKVCRKSALKILKGSDKIKIGTKEVEAFLGKSIYDLKDKNKSPKIGIVNGLAYTSVGGDMLEVESSISKGNGKLILTGKLGDVMKESVKTALSYLRSNAKELKIENVDFNSIDIHLHVPEGAVPKDGPSAGITIATSIYSSLIQKRVNNNLAMTGEITLHGKVLPIGGVKEKVLSSEKMGINTVLLPEKNMKDLDEIPEEVYKKIKIIPVNDIEDVFKIVFKEKEHVEI